MSRDDATLDRRAFLGTTLAAGAAAALGTRLDAAPAAAPIEEATLDELRAGLEAGRFTARDLAARYLDRIRALDQAGPALRSVIEVNPDALPLAEALDAERKAKGPRGPLHGIPVLLKDNLDTADRMKTTAGSLALADAPAPRRDAFAVQRLREAGALILGKTNLSEWANFRSSHSTSGWSGRGGQTRNPYALDRNPIGSSSGSAVAVAASLCAVAVGTETDGSIVAPASACGIVGLKPTVGLLSRSGIIPISPTQDTAGPMARTVRDAALLLNALVGEDPADAATAAAKGHRSPDYTRTLDPAGLKGARLGVVKGLLGRHEGLDAVTRRALDVLRAQGAILEEVELQAQGADEGELEVLLYEFKASLDAYLGARGGAVKRLADLLAFNARTPAELALFGQDLMEKAQAKGPLTEPAYLKALEACRTVGQELEAQAKAHRLDAFVAPTGSPTWLTDPVNGDPGGYVSCSTFAAVAGTPHITVPAGFAKGLPVGLSFFGLAWSEPTLLRLAFAFEQASKARRPPTYPATLPL